MAGTDPNGHAAVTARRVLTEEYGEESVADLTDEDFVLAYAMSNQPCRILKDR